ncbi:hypothetical protein Mmol_1840 [Methylotenera mobilis JLW8]|uniref:Uncharacterized protein n=1 Tax=Methylotenera mobilis (strain JLW8 / ATCC BAA-1282 / DSM 17540) TaxID=583345 RepID=C6WXU5_METML|nr:hypothetical protein Mmol_1840 [Methylotenera mobilis JLW8]
MHYKRKNLRFEWILDAQYLYSMSAIARIGGTNRYIIYCLVRTVTQNDSGEILISGSPYLIAQPTAYIHKKPDIAYIKEYEKYVEKGLVDEDGNLYV